MSKGRGKPALRILLLAAVYFAAGKLGLLLPIVQENITLLWAPSGVALAAVLLFGPGVWPGIALGAFLVNWSTGAPLGACLGIATGNTLEALAGGGLLLRVGFDRTLRRVRDVLGLLALGAAASPLISASLGVSSLAAAGLLPVEKALLAGLYWWLGDAIGVLLITPVALTWTTLPRRPWPKGRVLEVIALAVCLFAASSLMLSFWMGSGIPHPPLSSILFPFLVWAALRFGPRGAATATLAAVGIAIWATASGLTPFIRGTMEERLVYLHSYMGIAAVTSLLLAAIFAERRLAEGEIRGSEATLRESEERLRLALDAGRCGVWDWDIAGGRLTWSDRLFEIHGVSRESFQGRFEDFNRLIHPDDAERVGREVRRALEEGAEYQIEFRAVRPDGGVRWISTRGRAFYDDEGRPVRMLGATLDVTERHQAEEERARLLVREREARAEAEAANEAKDRFLAALSHELRTPLTPVLALVSRLERDERLRSVADELAMIRRNVELESRLIDDLLDLTRIVRGKLQLQHDITDAREILEHALDICCEAETASGRLRVETDFAPADHRVWADAPRIMQVFWNLLNNAVKFTPEGGLVRVRSRRDGAWLEIEVSDTGIGIDPDLLPRIFNAFEQGGEGVSSRPRGLGLGLAISKAIAELHGGWLAAASDGPGRGSSFTLRLPASLPAPALEPAGAGRPSPKAEVQNPESLSILLVEDHADTAEAMAELLRLLGHRVVVAGGVAAALAAARRAREEGGLDLVISDLGLPDGSGLDVMRELGGRQGLPGIALSGYGMEEDVRKSREAGFNRHLTKPVGLQSLETAIRQTLRPEASE